MGLAHKGVFVAVEDSSEVERFLEAGYRGVGGFGVVVDESHGVECGGDVVGAQVAPNVEGSAEEGEGFLVLAQVVEGVSEIVEDGGERDSLLRAAGELLADHEALAEEGHGSDVLVFGEIYFAQAVERVPDERMVEFAEALERDIVFFGRARTPYSEVSRKF